MDRDRGAPARAGPDPASRRWVEQLELGLTDEDPAAVDPGTATHPHSRPEVVGRLLSLNVGGPREVAWEGRTVRTAIWKDPVEGPRMVRRLNIDGDDQADRAAHGGEHRAVFVYQIDSYRYWERELGRRDAIERLQTGPHRPRARRDGADRRGCGPRPALREWPAGRRGALRHRAARAP